VSLKALATVVLFGASSAQAVKPSLGQGVLDNTAGVNRKGTGVVKLFGTSSYGLGDGIELKVRLADFFHSLHLGVEKRLVNRPSWGASVEGFVYSDRSIHRQEIHVTANYRLKPRGKKNSYNLSVTTRLTQPTSEVNLEVRVGQDRWLKGRQAVRWWAATDIGSMLALNAWGLSGGGTYMINYDPVWLALGLRLDGGVFAQGRRLALERRFAVDYPDHLVLIQPVLDVWVTF
jgi:hypothetical protein